jgi:hypothetical protein
MVVGEMEGTQAWETSTGNIGRQNFGNGYRA